jgi:hypothetical protein
LRRIPYKFLGKPMKKETQIDAFLEKRLTKYDRWMAKG